jgi:hypothetical protein
MKFVQELIKFPSFNVIMLYLCKNFYKMKRIYGIVLVVVVIMTLAGGCGDKEEPIPQPKTPPPIQQ